MYKTLLDTKKLTVQYKAAALFRRFDVQEQEKWENRAYFMEDKSLDVQMYWITNAYYSRT